MFQIASQVLRSIIQFKLVCFPFSPPLPFQQIEPTVRRARLPVATTTTTSLIASFSLWKKKGTPAAADPKADSKMAEAAAKNLAETIQHSDQLFDENNFQEAYDLLVKCAVSRYLIYLYFYFSRRHYKI